jgi:hypothetical protein
MGFAHAIIKAAHARGTHHWLALDALDHLTTPDAAGWRDLFHMYARAYCEGAKAPDDEFKDFQNHVLHPRDRYWGGAPEKAQAWYDNLVAALARGDWPTAVWCAGVLSHYALDPMMPFHTAQSEAENNIHAATEWSINRSYAQLSALAEAQDGGFEVTLSSAQNWLALAVCAGADRANAGYEKLIAHYDIHRGVVDPPSGLDVVAQRLVADMIGFATRTFAVILDRAFQEAGVSPPAVSLALEVATAIVSMPLSAWRKRVDDAGMRAQVEAIYDELKRTGTVEANLREEERVVREAHRREVLAKLPRVEPAQVFPFWAKPEAPTRIERDRVATAGGAPAASARREPEPTPALAAAGKVEAPAHRDAATGTGRVIALRPRATEAARPRGVHLTPDQDVVDAPSIGPKTAERLYAVGIDTVGDFLNAHPIALAARLDVKHIDEQTITDWQDQARLVCAVPGLRGTHAQLLVGSGYRTAASLADAEADKLCADVLSFAASAEGARILRDGNPPDIERIKGWLESARSIRAA